MSLWGKAQKSEKTKKGHMETNSQKPKEWLGIIND
jgi:hypothetical protein